MLDFFLFRNVPTARRQVPPWAVTTKAAPSDTTTRVPLTQVRWTVALVQSTRRLGLAFLYRAFCLF